MPREMTLMYIPNSDV
jgi:hypothetical protein